MSSLSQILRRLTARTNPTSRSLRHPDMLPLRDWADLPAHHPHVEHRSS